MNKEKLESEIETLNPIKETEAQEVRRTSLLSLTLSELNLRLNKLKTPKKRYTAKIPDTLRKKSNVLQTNLDHVLNQIGSFGLYQKIQFLLVGFLAILPSMVAYSYVFVSATPKFTCSVVREIQLMTLDDASGKLLNKIIIDQESDDPFEKFKAEKSEFVVETRRFIRLMPKQKENLNITFDNNCEIDEKLLKKKLSYFQTSTPTTLPSNQQRASKAKMLQSTFKCVEWLYDDSLYGRTTVTDWNLVCLKSHLKAVTQNAFILGTGCSLFTGILSDKLGRKKAMILMITLMVLVLNITQFFMHTQALTINQKFVIFTISRFIQGIAQTMYSISFVLLLEITGPKNRVTAGNILAYSFSIGQMIIVGLAYFFKDWLKINWALAIYVIPFFMYYWLVPESPRWLLSVNRVRTARRVIEKITRVNKSYEARKERIMNYLFDGKKKSDKKIEIDLESQESWVYIFSLLQEEANKLSVAKKNTSYTQTLIGITRSPVLMRRCFILFYTWMVILAVYLGIGMGISGNLDKIMNPYLVFLIAAICEFISIVTCHLVLDKYGRKYPLVVFMILSAISIYLIPVNFESRPWVSIGFYFLSKYSIGAAQLTCMIFTSELYPTPMRSTGVGLSFALARLGGVWAPQINVLSSTLGSIYVPFIIFSCLSLLAGLLCFYLPETLNKKLPENIKEAKALK